MLGICMVLATLLMLAATVTSLFSLKRVKWWVRGCALLCGWLLFLRSALSDSDTTLVHHGHYNLAVFLLVFALGFTLSAVAVAALKLVKAVSPALCWGTFVVALAVFWSFWMLSSADAFRQWPDTVQSRLRLQWPQCSLDFHSIPWLSVLPTRTFNFFRTL